MNDTALYLYNDLLNSKLPIKWSLINIFHFTSEKAEEFMIELELDAEFKFKLEQLRCNGRVLYNQ